LISTIRLSLISTIKLNMISTIRLSRFQRTEADSKQTQTARFRWKNWLRLSKIKRYMKTKSKNSW
jgi:hypothetical protein